MKTLFQLTCTPSCTSARGIIVGMCLVGCSFVAKGFAQEAGQSDSSRIGPQSQTQISQQSESGVRAGVEGAENPSVQEDGMAPLSPTIESLTEATNAQVSEVSPDDEQAALKREKLATIQARLKLLAQFRAWNSAQQGDVDELLASVDEYLGTNVSVLSYEEGQVELDRVNKLLVELRLALKNAKDKQEAKAGLETQILEAQASLQLNSETVPKELAEIVTLEQQVSEQLLQELLVFQESTSVEELRIRTQELEEGVSQVSAQADALKKQLAQAQIGRIRAERDKVVGGTERPTRWNRQNPN
jgi:hypothetical protein